MATAFRTMKAVTHGEAYDAINISNTTTSSVFRGVGWGIVPWFLLWRSLIQEIRDRLKV